MFTYWISDSRRGEKPWAPWSFDSRLSLHERDCAKPNGIAIRIIGSYPYYIFQAVLLFKWKMAIGCMENFKDLILCFLQQQVQNFGEPFFLVIHEGETLEEVKVRIQKKLQVPDEEFSKVLILCCLEACKFV